MLVLVLIDDEVRLFVVNKGIKKGVYVEWKKEECRLDW